ncbi:MAG: M12 family metallopeptidase [Anaerolineales bacterium]|nr:M12 family metallopeptidase [Anaerolineales bacterium]
MPEETKHYGEFQESEDLRHSYIAGVTFWNKRVDYVAIDERAVFEGDILLGTVEQMELLRKINEREIDAVSGLLLEGLVITGSRFRWPKAMVIFKIDDNLPNKQRVFDAIKHWEENTNVRFREWTNEENYVRIQPGNGCAAHVGMQGGEQLIMLGDGCSTGNAIHEIGHCIGLWHEHSREDRDHFVQINHENIIPQARHNFDQHISDGDDIFEYDYASIMHYPANAFAIDASKPTIISPQPIGQRVSLSPADIETVNKIYPRHTVYLPIVIRDV